jgi:hypothetical protein
MIRMISFFVKRLLVGRRGSLQMKKTQLEQLVAGPPEFVDVNSLIEPLQPLDKIERAEKQLSQSKGIPHEVAKQRLSQWLQ